MSDQKTETFYLNGHLTKDRLELFVKLKEKQLQGKKLDKFITELMFSTSLEGWQFLATKLKELTDTHTIAILNSTTIEPIPPTDEEMRVFEEIFSLFKRVKSNTSMAKLLEIQSISNPPQAVSTGRKTFSLPKFNMQLLEADYFPVTPNQVMIPELLVAPFKEAKISESIGKHISSIKIAVLDSGCYLHDDLMEHIDTTNSKSFVDNEDWWNDINGHGTHCCGIIAGKNGAAELKMSEGTKAPKLLVVQVLDQNGEGHHDDICKGIEYAIAQEVDIISMSLGGKGFYKPTYLKILEAISKDILVVVAAGNEGSWYDWNLNFPASIPEVIKVASVSENGNASSFSSVGGSQIDICGPGENIISTSNTNGYVKMSGTSMATPCIAACLAMLIAYEKILNTGSIVLKCNYAMKQFIHKITFNSNQQVEKGKGIPDFRELFECEGLFSHRIGKIE